MPFNLKNIFKGLLRRKPDVVTDAEVKSRVAAVQTYPHGFTHKDEIFLAEGKCPYCKAKDRMRGGPEGGLSMNALCTVCYMEFNICLAAPALSEYLGIASTERRAWPYGIHK